MLKPDQPSSEYSSEHPGERASEPRGQQVQQPRHSDARQPSVLNLHYCGFTPMHVRGPVTGQLYSFSRSYPLQEVDARDAVSILKTRLFRHLR